MKHNNEGAWIFISHSLKDWEKVRSIRNVLEEKGHKPLLFFLKCLNDDSEIDDLIKREIDTRNWFILCDSKNSRESKWVKAEVDYIKSLEGKIYEVIDLDTDVENQLEKIERLSKRITVFLSYSRYDRSIAQEFNRILNDNDYRVFDDTQLLPGDWTKQINNNIDEAVKRGFFLLLITENSIKSKSVMDEILYALNKSYSSAKGGNIIPISFINMNKLFELLPKELAYHISQNQICDFSKGSLSNNIKNLITTLKIKEME